MPESSFKDLTILVTGGGGYIGSHCILQLLEHKFKVVAIDNFNNAVKGTLILYFRYIDRVRLKNQLEYIAIIYMQILILHVGA